MKDIKLTIQIDKPVQDVFAFAINPENTPKWVDSVTREQTNEWPVKLGTIYRNQNITGVWSEYTVTEFEHDKLFTLTKHGGLLVRYKLTPLGHNTTELEYHVRTETGEFEDSFIETIVAKLKEVLETAA